MFAHLDEKFVKMWNAKKWNFFQVHGHENLHFFFDFLESLLKWWKPPPVDHKTLEMYIFAHLDEKYAKMWKA